MRLIFGARYAFVRLRPSRSCLWERPCPIRVSSTGAATPSWAVRGRDTTATCTASVVRYRALQTPSLDCLTQDRVLAAGYGLTPLDASGVSPVGDRRRSSQGSSPGSAAGPSAARDRRPSSTRGSPGPRRKPILRPFTAGSSRRLQRTWQTRPASKPCRHPRCDRASVGRLQARRQRDPTMRRWRPPGPGRSAQGSSPRTWCKFGLLC